jgi:hypothetical protein
MTHYGFIAHMNQSRLLTKEPETVEKIVKVLPRQSGKPPSF